MKDPIKIHNNQEEKINEIFGRIAKFFSPKKTKQQKIQDLEFQSKVEKYKSARLLNPDTCDKEATFVDVVDKKGKKTRTVKSQLPKKTVRISLLPSGEIMIDRDKVIKNYSELYIENTIRGQGMGVFRKLSVRDLVCYDLNADIYGIAWLLSPYSSYIAEKISGKLYANKFNQSVNFDGHWQTGKFMGRLAGTQALNRVKYPNVDLNSNFLQLQDLIKKVKQNFEDKFQEVLDRTKFSLDTNTKFDTDDSKLFSILSKKIKESSDEKLKALFNDILNFKNYLSNIESKGLGKSSYVSSDEIFDIKSRIDNKDNADDIILDIEDLMKRFRIIDSKMNKFYNEYKNLLAKGQKSPETKKKGQF